MKITAVGDVIIGRRIPKDFVGYSELEPIITSADARFFNLETTLHKEGQCYASETSGGTYLRTDPEVLWDVKEFGFNMTSFNNNHATDYGIPGLRRTLEAVEESGLVHAGVGRNLGEAAAPKYLDTASGRVALISVNSSLVGEMIAGEQTARIKGRPGVNPIKVESYIELTDVDFDAIKAVIDKTGINVQRNIEKADGYHGGVSNTAESFGGLTLRRGEQTGRVRKIREQDLTRVKKSIEEAKLCADYIMISMHTHEMGKAEKEDPADFAIDFAHFCIDAGADAVVGHGPHLLRPIEIYNGKPIFYSLGDFVLELYNVEFAPQEMYNLYGMDGREGVNELLAKRSKDFTIGLMCDKRMFEAVIPVWEVDECGKLQSLELYPIKLAMDGKRGEIGLPRLATDTDYLDGFIRRSAAFGTKIEKSERGTLTVKL